VSDWTIQVPYRSRDESLIDVASHVRHQPGQDDDRAVMRPLVISAHIDGVATTAGELIDHIDGLEPSQRRALLDRARTEAGLKPTADVDAERRAAATFRSGGGFTVQRCAIADCVNMPTNGLGAIVEIDAQRWHCPAHEHLAEPGDMEPHGSGLRYSENGVLVPIDPADDRREAEARESERRQREARYADRATDAAAHAEYQQAKRERLIAESPEHLRQLIP